MRRLTEEENKRRLKWWKRGLDDRRIAITVGRSSGTIAHWRRQRGLPSNNKRARKHRIGAVFCEVCGTLVYRMHSAKYCRPCGEYLKRHYDNPVAIEKYKLRMKLLALAEERPEEAKELARWMEISEGEDWKDWAINGIVEKKVPE